ncbi:MAG: hypothetical protein R3208_00830 [Ketobacteraceae bacterium]|nr:hypothetical protein [Ketobacteraceae bacterium]
MRNAIARKSVPLPRPGTTWFSTNRGKAEAERFFLLYSPVWMALMAVMMITGWAESSSDSWLLIHSLLVALPLVMIPLWQHYRRFGILEWQSVRSTYWFKANLYIALFSFFGNYFGTFYFFDMLGMVYQFPSAETTLESALLSQGDNRVPLIMYFYTHAYFMTYHVTATLVIRRLGVHQVLWLFLSASFMVGYCWAWIETAAMANPLMANSFYYENRSAMLTYGSAIYATYFIASFPIFFAIDESSQKPWTLKAVCAGALSASMLTFYLLDFTMWAIGRL